MINRWTKDDINEAIELNQKGYSFEEIGKYLDRTTRGIQIKLNRLGYKQTKNIFYEVVICEKCQTPFNSLKIYNRKYCSKSCSTIDNNHKRKIKNDSIKKNNKCIICDKIITRRSKFCSNTCYAEYNKRLIFKEIENNNFSLDNKQTESSWIKLYLIDKYGEKCMKCNWNERHPITNKVPIQMNHIDGNSDNNKLDNVELLCPNCHSLTPNYGSLNKGNGRLERILTRKKQKEKIEMVLLA